MWHSAWNDASLLNRIALLLVAFAICAFGYMGIRWAAARPVFAIRGVTVTGPVAHADPAHITAVIQQQLRGTFFTLDLAAARDAIRRVPWLRNVAVRRQWPSRLEVVIEEHQPLAHWNDIALVNVQGEVFEAEYGDDLPDFYGPEGSAAEIALRYREFSTPVRARPVTIDTLSRSARGAWEVKLEDGLTIALGREHVAERWLRWMQLGDRYRDGIAQGGQLAAVDMRYPNGFAARVIRAEKEHNKNGAAGSGTSREQRG